jgi:hypothetical protein
MDERNRALDNIVVERLWRSLKYEDIYLKDYRSMEERGRDKPGDGQFLHKPV